MKLTVIRACVLSTLCVISICPAIGAQSEDIWQRVITEQDLTVDVDTASLRFEPDRVVSARFRTVLARPERLQNDQGATYKSRIETIQFKRSDGTYRSSAISLLDASDKIVLSSAEPRPWKPMRASASRWLSGLERLYPFRTWTVITYRPVDIRATDGLDSTELDKLVGSRISLTLDLVKVGTRACNSPRYESRTLTDGDLDKLLGVPIRGLGFSANPVDVIALKCESSGWQAGQSLLVPMNSDRMLMLWEGVFLELAVEKGPKQFTIPFKIQDVRDQSVIVTSP